ncbi:tyrosine-protein kinase Fer isoform X3 [Culicoides brevitarsis]|uniref:tyrosine-protein kinase Fer isoform X3 n=1 Tax=Culicoides brevitarsis TaxID=469753 RepID=UPI00307C48B3
MATNFHESETTQREKTVSRLKIFNFSLNWDLKMTQCKPCRSKPGNILTRRLCRNKKHSEDNELYRSNSFKFERFEKRDTTEEDKNNIFVCEDYSLPLDYFKSCSSNLHPKQLSHSNIQSKKQSFKVELLEGYSQPNDDATLVTTASFASNEKKISNRRVYSDSSLPQSSECELEQNLDSGNSLSDIGKDIFQLEKNSKPSLYYYSDIAKRQDKKTNLEKTLFLNQNKTYFKRSSTSTKKTRSLAAKEKSKKLYHSSESETSENSECPECKNTHSILKPNVKPLLEFEMHAFESNDIFTSQAIFGSYSSNNNALSDCSFNSCDTILKSKDMNSKKQIYETAFDSRITKNDDISILDNITKNPEMFPFPNDLLMISDSSLSCLGIQEAEIRGSDSGISLQSREEMKQNVSTSEVDKQITFETNTPYSLNDLPFDMPKLERRHGYFQSECSTKQIDSTNLEICLVKKSNANNIERQSLTLNFNERKSPKSLKFGTINGYSNSNNTMLKLDLGNYNQFSKLIDVDIPFDRQNWYHGAISRIEAENVLRPLDAGSFLVRNSESAKQDYSLSLKSAKGFMHMRIQRSDDSNKYILGQFSRPFDTIPEMIQHFCLNRLPVRGAEHMCLVKPVVVQIL